jgi:flagellar biogenesis protein FliO
VVCAAVSQDHHQQREDTHIMKFIGAMFFGLLTMGTAVYFVARSKEQRASDFSTSKNLTMQVFTSIKNYLTELLNPKQSTEEMV